MNIGTAIATLAMMNMNRQSSPGPKHWNKIKPIKAQNRPELIDDKKRLQHIARDQERRRAGRRGGGGPGCKPRCRARSPQGASRQASPPSSPLVLRGNVH